MATKKTYTVRKDGVEIEQLKTLVAAKKLADAEGAEVICDGVCIYQGAVEGAQEAKETQDAQEVQETRDAHETVIVHADPIVAETPKQPEMAEPVTEQYRLKSLMNVRKKPSMDADILSTKPEGTVVRVLAVENGWLHLIDGTYILFEGGKFAEKI